MTTGATPEDVERAAIELNAEWGYSPAGARQIANAVMGCAVPETHRIIALDDLQELWAGYHPDEDRTIQAETEFGLRMVALIAGPARDGSGGEGDER